MACSNNNDEAPGQLTISSITTTGTDLQSGEETTVDLNGATAATDVPLDADIKVTFSKAVDESTNTSSNVMLENGTSTVNTMMVTSGSIVTITPTENLERGALYTLTLIGEITADDGGIFTTETRNFTVAGRKEVVPPQSENMVAYWKFDGDATDKTGDYDAGDEVSVTYTEDRFGEMGSAAEFDGDETIIEVPNADELVNTDNFTISFWVKTNSEDHVNADGNPIGHFVFGLGAFMGIEYEIADDYHSAKYGISYEAEDGTGVSEDMWFPADATDNTTGGWQGWTYAIVVSPEQMEM